MSLNSIVLSCNKIKEIEENKPNSPPSIASLEKRKTMPDLCSSKNYNICISSVPLKKRKSKSLSSSLNTKNLTDIFFSESSFKNNNSFNNKNNKIDIPKLNLNEKKENKDNKDNNTKHRENYCFTDERKNSRNSSREYNNSDFKNKEIKTANSNYISAFKIYKPDSARINSSYLKNITNNATKKFNLIEEAKEKNINNIYLYKNKRITKKYINKSYSNVNFISNKARNIKDIKKEFNPLVKQLKNIDNNTKIYETEVASHINPKIKKKILAKSYITLDHMNYLSNSINKPYIKKKIEDAKNFDSFRKKEGFDSEKRYSLQQKINKKKPLILNVNLQKKKNIILFKISQFKRILNSKGIFHILRFLDFYDIINLFKTKNKKMFILLNTALAKIYYSNIKECLLKYYNIIELLKCSIVRSQIKDSLKIDLVLNTRLKCNNNNLIEPMYYQLAYIYNYYQKIKPQKELITKEDCENKGKKLKMYDYYTFDLYPENYKNNDMNNNSIFISKELPIKKKDNNNLAYVQSILPFIVNDKAIINLELYTSNNGFIIPESIKIIIKSYNLKNYLKMLYDKEINNPRISEYEELCAHWKKINLYEYHDIITQMCKIFFEPFFDIKKIYYENIGIYIFKICLKAVKVGKINKREIGIKIKIKNRNEMIENEIRKNNLLFEKRDTYEIRVGDEMIYYFSMK